MFLTACLFANTLAKLLQSMCPKSDLLESVQVETFIFKIDPPCLQSPTLLVGKMGTRSKRDFQGCDCPYTKNNAGDGERNTTRCAVDVHELARRACKATGGSKKSESESSNRRGVSFSADAIKGVPCNHRHGVE